MRAIKRIAMTGVAAGLALAFTAGTAQAWDTSVVFTSGRNASAKISLNAGCDVKTVHEGVMFEGDHLRKLGSYRVETCSTMTYPSLNWLTDYGTFTITTKQGRFWGVVSGTSTLNPTGISGLSVFETLYVTGGTREYAHKSGTGSFSAYDLTNRPLGTTTTVGESAWGDAEFGS